MKRFTLALLTLLSIQTTGRSATPAPVIIPNRIVAITPSSATFGQNITVHVKPLLPPNPLRNKWILFGRGIGRQPATQAPRTPRIQFTGPNGAFVNGLNVRALDAEHYSVKVPLDARSGPMRVETISGTTSVFNTSTARFTLVECGYAIANLTQFNIVSIMVDGFERLAPDVVPPVPPTSATVFGVGIAATPGNHVLRVTVGRRANQTVLGDEGVVEATTPLQGIDFGPEVPLAQILTAPLEGENAAGPQFHALWQHTEQNLDGSILGIYAYGFDYEETPQGQTQIPTRWTFQSDSTLIGPASGTLIEPTVWPLNPASIEVPLMRDDGTIYDRITYDIVARRFTSSQFHNYDFTRFRIGQ